MHAYEYTYSSTRSKYPTQLADMSVRRFFFRSVTPAEAFFFFKETLLGQKLQSRFFGGESTRILSGTGGHSK